MAAQLNVSTTPCTTKQLAPHFCVTQAYYILQKYTMTRVMSVKQHTLTTNISKCVVRILNKLLPYFAFFCGAI